MSRTKLLLAVFIISVLAIGILFLVTRQNAQSLPPKEETKPVEELKTANKKQAVIERPENFSEGVWIKKYPFEYACFKFETPDGIKIVCDPFEMYETVSPDIVTESHQDADHVDTSKLTGIFKLYNGPGEFEEKGIKFTGIAGRHNKSDSAVTNTIFIFNIYGIKIAHFASQGQVPDEEMLTKLNEFKGIDVLLIQGSKNREYKNIKMTVDECCSVIDRLNPKIVIPEHGTANIAEDFAKHYGTKVEYMDYKGFVITKDILQSIQGHRIIDMDNPGPKE